MNDALAVLASRVESAPWWSYKLAEGIYALDQVYAARPELDKGRMRATALFSTSMRDRQGDILETGGIHTLYHRENPVVLLDHGKRGWVMPLGRTQDRDTHEYLVRIDADRGEAWQTTSFNPHCPIAAQVYRFIDDGDLRGNSIGYRPLKSVALADVPDGVKPPLHLQEVELLEITWTALGVNPECIRAAMYKTVEGKSLLPEVKAAFEPYAAKAPVWSHGATLKRPPWKWSGKLWTSQDEAKHPRGQPENAGQWGPGGYAKKPEPQAQVGTAPESVTTKPETGKTAWKATATTPPENKAKVPRSTVPFMTDAKVAKIKGKGENGKILANDIAKFLDKHAARKGAQLLSRGPKDLKAISDALVDEAKHALAQDNNAIGWYDKTVKEAMTYLYELHPELKDNIGKDGLFKAFIAITSNGQPVDKNFDRGNELYEKWKATGRIEVDGIYGGRERRAINKGLKRLQTLIDETGGDLEAVRTFMLKTYTVGQLKKDGYRVSGENQKTEVRGAMIFGPKIGSFYNNLNGDYSTVTMDRWFMRTFNRIRGVLSVPSVKATQKQAKRVKNVIDSMPEETLHGMDRFKLAEQAQLLATAPDLKQEKDLSVWAKKNTPDLLKWTQQTFDNFQDGGFKDKNETNRAAKALHENIYGINDAPGGGGNRNWVRTVIGETQNKLKASGVDVTNADLQALLWYYEKDLWIKLGYGADRAVRSDYAKAAKKLLDRKRAEKANSKVPA